MNTTRDIGDNKLAEYPLVHVVYSEVRLATDKQTAVLITLDHLLTFFICLITLAYEIIYLI